jgi:hypothetical protein
MFLGCLTISIGMDCFTNLQKKTQIFDGTWTFQNKVQSCCSSLRFEENVVPSSHASWAGFLLIIIRYAEHKKALFSQNVMPKNPPHSLYLERSMWSPQCPWVRSITLASEYSMSAKSGRWSLTQETVDHLLGKWSACSLLHHEAASYPFVLVYLFMYQSCWYDDALPHDVFDRPNFLQQCIV